MVYHLSMAFLWSRGHFKGGSNSRGCKCIPATNHNWGAADQAAGIALGFQKRVTKAVAMTYTGDGGTSQGDFYEGINFAGAYTFSCNIYYPDNNQYAISTPRDVQSAGKTLAQKGISAGIPSILVDGMDPLGGLCSN